MPDTTPIAFNFINPNFFFYSHEAQFVESTGVSENVIAQAAQSVAASAYNLVPLSFTFLLKGKLEAGYYTLKPIPIKVQGEGDEYMASFELANIHAAGETWTEAARHLKSLILDIFDSLSAENPTALGRDASDQLSTLKIYVKKDNPQQRPR